MKSFKKILGIILTLIMIIPSVATTPADDGLVIHTSSTGLSSGQCYFDLDGFKDEMYQRRYDEKAKTDATKDECESYAKEQAEQDISAFLPLLNIIRPRRGHIMTLIRRLPIR